MLPSFFRDIDVHTHVPGRGAIVSVFAGEPLPEGCDYYSTGIHPWHAGQGDTAALLDDIRAKARDPRVVAVGECGLDARRGPSMAEQLPVFEAQVRLSEELSLPLVIHCVGCWGQLLDVRRRLRPRQPWIVHGFRGNAILAVDLWRHGIFLSLGPRHNAAVRAALPAQALLRETDAQP